MSKFDNLIKIIQAVVGGIKLPEHLSVENNKLSINIGNFKTERPVTFNGTIICIDADTSEGRIIAQKVFENAEQLLEKDERAIEAEFGKLIAESAPAAQSQPGDDQLLAELKRFVPAKDIPIIKAALFIRRLHHQGANVSKYKQLISQKYGSRGNNITNLVTAGYYENYLTYIYNHLMESEEPEFASLVFNDIYEEAVTQYPFAVFVAITKPYDQLKEEVINKIRLNLLSDQHMLNIHGIGKPNSKTISALLKDDDITRFYVSEPDSVELEKTVYVRIYF